MIVAINKGRESSCFILNNDGIVTLKDRRVVGIIYQDYGDFYIDFSESGVTLGASQLLNLSELLIKL